jgi:hypothetical protein
MARKIKEKCRIHKLDFPFYQYVETMVWCEECSTQEHPIMMTKMDGSYFRCPLCEKEVMVMQDIKTNVGTHWSSVCSRCKELEEKNIRFGRKNGKI